MKKNIQSILKSEDEHLAKFRQIVNHAMEEEQLIVENLLNDDKEIKSRSQKISDAVAKFGGSWMFIITFSIILFVWIVINSFLPKESQFDPFPFILMNLVLSAIAALQAPVIMMSQNRKEEKDRKRSENDYLINLKSELEVRSLQKKMDLLLEEQIKMLFESQSQQLEILIRLEKQIGNQK